jgi:hypothetical protein
LNASLFDPDRSYLVLSRRAGDDLQQLGVFGRGSRLVDRLRVLVGAARRRQLEPLPETLEQRFIACATLRGADVALVCCATEGAPGHSERTVTIEAALPADRAAELLTAGKGLAAF